jgi:general secretion pathway protein K
MKRAGGVAGSRAGGVAGNRAGKGLAGGQRGFALPIVLLTIVFLSVLGTALVTAGRQSTQRARNLIDSAIAEAAADGAVHQAIFNLLDQSGMQWVPDSRIHVLRYGRYIAEVRVEDESDKVNPNFAPPELLQALLVRLGVTQFAATNLAAAIVDWRTTRQLPRALGMRASQTPVAGPPEHPDPMTPQYLAAGRDYLPPGESFETIDELGAVLGMTPPLLARLQPHVTLFSDADPDASTTDPVVAAALGPDPPRSGRRNIADGPRAMSIYVVVRGPDRTSFAEHTVVRINALDGVRRYEILLRDVNGA